MDISSVCNRIKSVIRHDMNVCLIMRGLPGRGKSYMAKSIENYCHDQGYSSICSAADDYMIDTNGKYVYDDTKLSSCHNRCNRALIEAMERGVQVVIQHNTNVVPWDSSLLRANAEDLNYIVAVVEPPYAWCLHDELPAHLQDVMINQHSVSDSILSKMKARRQNIYPRYLAHWLSSRQLLSKIDDHIPAHDDRMKFYEQFVPNIEKIRHTRCHITTDFISGSSDEAKLDLDMFYHDMLVDHHVVLLAVFKDHRGVGALIAGVDGEVPLYNNYIKPDISYMKLPHITISVSEGIKAKDIGNAAYYFHQAYISYQSQQLHIPTGFHKIGDFTSYIFSQAIKLDTIYAGSYSFNPNPYSYARWKFSSSAEYDVFHQLSARKDVSIVQVPVSHQIIPHIDGKSWNLVDFRINPGKGRSDDELYTGNDLLRRYLPRGLSYLSSPTLSSYKVVVGLSKFTGSEDEDIGVNNEESNTSNPQHDAGIFFTRSMTTASKPWILAMEKANGEAAHASAIIIDGVEYIIAGSKNVHLIFRRHHRDDIDLYEGSRYIFAKEIAYCLYDKLTSLSLSAQDEFTHLLISQHLTAIFEYEDPMHPHIVALDKKQLKFITFTKSGLQDVADNHDDDMISYDRSSVNAMSPSSALHIAESIGLDTVWRFSFDINKLRELEAMILMESEVKFEGCVLYYMDDQEVLGLVKCKNAYYICSRAIREKISQYVKNIHEGLDIFQPKNTLKALLHISKKDNMDDRRVAMMKYTTSIHETFRHKILSKAIESKKIIGIRFDALIHDQVPMTSACKQQWLEVAYLILDDIMQSLVMKIDEIIRNVSSSLETSYRGMDDISAMVAMNEQVAHDLWSQIEAASMPVEAVVRNTWPQLFQSMIDKHGGGLNIKLATSSCNGENSLKNLIQQTVSL